MIDNSVFFISFKAIGNGYGKRQMQEAVQRMIAQGAKKIVVWTNEICVPAQHTYESVGFQFVSFPIAVSLVFRQNAVVPDFC